MDDQTTDRAVVPITADDVLPLSTAHLDRALDAAHQAVASAAERDRAARAALETAEQELSDARARLLACSTARQERVDELTAAEAQHHTACEQVVAARTREQDSVGAMAAAQRALAPLVRAERASAAVVDTGAPRDADGVAAVLEGVAEAARLVEDLENAPDTAPLVTWSEQLVAGSAPVREDAGAMLVELEQLDADWADCGGGELERDPVVVEAQAHLDARTEAVAAVQAGGMGTAAGHQARTTIELAHQRRTELEASGRRADPDELAQAVHDEEAALAHVGFDSWLDFRLTMSGAGVGALVERRRRIAAEELAEARSRLRDVRERRAAHHEALRRRRDELRRRAGEQLGVDTSQPLAPQLRAVLALPAPVRELSDEVARRAEAARAEVREVRASHSSAQRALTEATADQERASLEVDRCRTALEAADADLGAAEAQVADAATVRSERGASVEADATALAGATAALDQLTRLDHLPEDLDDAIRTLVHLSEQRATDGATPRLVDPLATLPVAATLQLVDALEAVGRPVELESTRRALLSALRHRSGVVTVLDGRRRRRPFGQRRRREPTVSTR
jgi:hypothetical protein